MDVNHVQAVQKHVRTYVGVFVALLIGTLLTVGISQVHLGETGNVAAALLIAALKAGLVAGFFMHLVSEKKAIYAIMVFAIVFLIALMFLTLGSMSDVVVLKHVA